MRPSEQHIHKTHQIFFSFLSFGRHDCMLVVLKNTNMQTDYYPLYLNYSHDSEIDSYLLFAIMTAQHNPSLLIFSVLISPL